MPMRRHLYPAVSALILLPSARVLAAGLDSAMVQPPVRQTDLWILFGTIGVIAALAAMQVMNSPT